MVQTRPPKTLRSVRPGEGASSAPAPTGPAGGLGRLGEAVGRRRRVVLGLAGAFVVAAAALGLGVQSHLSQGGFDSSAEPSVRAAALLQSRFGAAAANLVALVRTRSGTVDSPAGRAAGLALTRRLAAAPHVEQVRSYWSLDSLPALRADEALIVATIEGDQDQVVRREPAAAAALTHPPAAVTVEVGGFGPAFNEVNTVVEHDLARSEAVAVPLTMLLLLFVFGSAGSAALPMVVAGAAVTGTMAALRVITSFTPVSVFAINLTTALGLGLAIDYSLFMVARFREELADGRPVSEAVTATVASAGRTVAGSALTVAAALSTLFVFPVMFLRSFAIAGLVVALLSGLAAVVVLPAVLLTLGHRVNRFTVWSRSVRPPAQGLWSASARRVMRRPWVALVAGVAVLVVLGTPFLGVRLGYFDTRVLTPANHVRAVTDRIAADFGNGQADDLTVVPAAGHALGGRGLDGYAAALSLVSGVAHVDTTSGVYIHGVRRPAPAAYLAGFGDRSGAVNGKGNGSSWLAGVSAGDPMAPAGVGLVGSVRAVPSPAPVLVGGLPAQYADSTAVILGRLPLALGLIVVVMLGLLFAIFRSVLVPVKALVLNVLSLSATFGAMVWVFQEGHFSRLLGFTPTGSLVASMPILMFCVAFGLSMDYEVFLVSRIKEHHDAGLGNEEAVARGLQGSGRIVTAAALLMSIVFMSLVTGQISFIKLFGVGLTLAVLTDAVLIRGVLVPAVMKLAGAANWWAPRLRVGRSADAKLAVLAELAPFRSCSPRDLRQLARSSDILTLPARSLVVREGGRGDAFYVIVSGHAKVTRGGELVARLGPGQYFGELALLGPQPRNATVGAVTDLECVIIGKRAFSGLMAELPGFARAVLSGLAERVRWADQRLSGAAPHRGPTPLPR